MAILGMVEFSGITRGIVASDSMIKRAQVEILESGPIDPGKYLTAVTGDLACVEESVAAAIETAGAAVVYSLVLPNVHEAVPSILRGDRPPLERDAIAIVETMSAAGIVHAADAACKAADITLVTLHLALHIGGKGFMVVLGDVADVEAACEAGCRAAGQTLLDSSVVARPHEDFFSNLLNPMTLRKGVPQ